MRFKLGRVLLLVEWYFYSQGPRLWQSVLELSASSIALIAECECGQPEHTLTVRRQLIPTIPQMVVGNAVLPASPALNASTLQHFGSGSIEERQYVPTS
jgi:hypothetical protein